MNTVKYIAIDETVSMSDPSLPPEEQVDHTWTITGVRSQKGHSTPPVTIEQYVLSREDNGRIVEIGVNVDLVHAAANFSP